MKKISLDEVAYERLKAWKKGSRESFSSVVKRLLPERGNLGAILNHVQSMPRRDKAKDDIMEKVVNDRHVLWLEFPEEY